ncbi:hypothetical protein [Dactylosporangium sp. NPDC049140]|uniref:hypothetical protein n=1 Tax=Dactylosporangium sp. NPDC049140 TaxID=3155647 RepID=UPI0033E3FBAE
MSAYRVRMAEQPGHLVPRRLLGALRADPGTVFAAGVRVERTDGPPEFGVPDDVAHGPATVWVPDRRTGAVLPYDLEPDVLDLLDGAEPGRPLRSLPSRDRERVLCAAGVLSAPDGGERGGADEAVAYEARGFARVAGVIPPLHLGRLREHYRRLARTGRLRLGDGQSADRYVAHNEPIAAFLHRRLEGFMSTVAGRPVTASYSYLAGYRDGAVLPPHRDREQCEHTLSVLVDYAPEPAVEAPWPLELHLPQRRFMLYQALGDGVLFRGRTIPHARRPLPAGHSSTSILFHYVDADFAGELR